MRAQPRPRRRGALLAALVLAGFAAAPAASEPLGVGDALPRLTLPDQHGETRTVDERVRLVLFSRDMDGGRLIQSALEGFDGERLARLSTVYVSDVSRMPGFVRRLIAKPRMRRRPYPMLLDEEGRATAALPSEQGRATLLFLEGLRVTRIEHPGSAEAIRAALGAEPAP